MKIPKYAAIKQHIREQIRSGKLVEGDRVPSEYELVDQLGVGRSQARQALRELEIEGFLVRRQGSGSFVAPNAGMGPGQVLDAPRTVAVAFPEYDSAYIRELVEGFMEVLFRAGYGVTNYNLQLDEAGEVRFLESVVDSGMAGLLVWMGNETALVRKALVRLMEERFPVVMADRYFPDVDTDYVVSDNERIGYELTRALLEAGHERIGVARSEQDLATSQSNRVSGYERAMAEAGITPLGHWYAEVDVLDNRLPEQVNRCLAHRDRPTGFVCINDIIARGLQEELVRLGYSVPGDVALATVDDGVGSSAFVPGVLTIRQNGQAIGRRAGDLLLARLADFDRPVEHVAVPPRPVNAAPKRRRVAAQKGGALTADP